MIKIDKSIINMSNPFKIIVNLMLSIFPEKCLIRYSLCVVHYNLKEKAGLRFTYLLNLNNYDFLNIILLNENAV